MAGRKGLCFTMLDEGAASVSVGVDDAGALDAERSVQALQDEGGEIAGLGDDINQAVEDAGELDEALDVVDTSLVATDATGAVVAGEGDGLPPIAAEAIAICVAGCDRRLGIMRVKRAVPMTEAFATTSSRVMATRIARES